MKKLRKLFAVLLAVCMMMSLLSVSAFAEESLAEESVLFKCEFACEHTHTGEDGTCYETQKTCSKHMHGDGCYTDGALTCTEGVLDQICGFDYEHPVHDANCNHVHSGEKCGYACGKEVGAYDCDTSDAHEDHTGCPIHAHDACAYNCGKTEDTLECGKDLHTHVPMGTEGQEPCYQYHIHVGEAEANGCYGRVKVCVLAEHTHTPDCLKEDVRTAFDEVVTKLGEIDSLQTMQDNRKNFTVSGDYNAGSEASVTEHTTAQTGYATYRANMLVQRKAAQDAYKALDPAVQKMIDSALVEKLSDELGTWWVVDHNPTMTRTINPATAESYDYQLIQTWSRQYEISPHATAADNSACLFILVDSSEEEGTWTWMADGRYEAGQSNYELAYCSDVSVTTVDGTHYKRTNLEENGYYGVDAAEHIRAIVVNSYPFVTVDEMKANLIAGGLNRAMVNQMGRGEMIAAVQMAIWSFANGDTSAVEGNTSYGLTYRLRQDRCFHDYTNEHDYWWNSVAGYGTYYPEIGNRIDTVVAYLRGLEGLSLTDKDIIITGVDILGAEPVQTTDREGVYNVAMKVQLNGGGSSKKDNITITATSYTENDDGTRNITGTSTTKVDGKTVYDLVVEAKYGEMIEVVVAGTQHLPQGAYFYQPEPSDRNKDGVYTSKETSQNLVGVAMGDTNVSAKKIITDNGIPAPEEESPVSAKLTVKKTNESGTPLTGAEFTVYRVSDDGETVYNIGTYPVDENGCAVLTGLLAGTYQLKETKAPAGYVAMDETVVFEVTDGETAEIRLFNNPDDVRCDGAEDGYILTVVNCPEPVPSNPRPDPKPDPKPGPDPEVTIPDEEPPLAELPDEDPPLADLPDEDAPLAMLPEEDVPLALLPMTGDASALWMALSALSGAGLFVTRKKRDEE